MRIIVSPAKKMRVDVDGFAPHSLPQFLPKTMQCKAALDALSPAQQQAIWKCNDAIAALNTQRLCTMDLQQSGTPALFSYEGIQYQYMAPNVFEDAQYDYLQEHLRILSGFYGLLRPFDGVTPYRLEMQAKLSVEGHKDLYGFWGDALAKQLIHESDLILNLASKEYSKAISPHLPPHFPFVTVTFGQLVKGKLVEKGTMCKMARGQMVRWMAENQITPLSDCKAFDQLSYRYAPEYSTEQNLTFLKAELASHP